MWEVGFHCTFGFARGDEVADRGHDGIHADVAEFLDHLCERRDFNEGDGFHGCTERDGEFDVHVWMSWIS